MAVAPFLLRVIRSFWVCWRSFGPQRAGSTLRWRHRGWSGSIRLRAAGPWCWRIVFLNLPLAVRLLAGRGWPQAVPVLSGCGLRPTALGFFQTADMRRHFRTAVVARGGLPGAALLIFLLCTTTFCSGADPWGAGRSSTTVELADSTRRFRLRLQKDLGRGRALWGLIQVAIFLGAGGAGRSARIRLAIGALGRGWTGRPLPWPAIRVPGGSAMARRSWARRCSFAVLPLLSVAGEGVSGAGRPAAVGVASRRSGRSCWRWPRPRWRWRWRWPSALDGGAAEPAPALFEALAFLSIAVSPWWWGTGPVSCWWRGRWPNPPDARPAGDRAGQRAGGAAVLCCPPRAGCLPQ